MEDVNTSLQFTAVDFDPFAGPAIVRLAPATEPQTEIWVTCQLGGDDASRAFNESISLRLIGPLNVRALQQAWQQLIDRHEALHSAFSADGRHICVFSSISSEIEQIDCLTHTIAEQERRATDYVAADAQYVFDLKNGPLVKAGLICLSENEHHFTITGHHIVCDGWSLGVMLQDLSQLYSALVQGLAPRLTPAPLFSQYAVEQQQYVAGDAYRETLTYWQNQYRGTVPVLDLPIDFTRPAMRTYDIARQDYPLATQLSQAVKKMGARMGASFVTTLVAAFEVFLYRLTGEHDVVLGLPAAGQSATGYTGLVGHCVNLLPLRSFLRPDQPFQEYLSQRREELLDAYDHQQLTFSTLLKKLAIPRDSSRVPLVPVIFNLDMGLDDGVQFYGLDHQLISNPRAYGAVDLFINVSGSSAMDSLVVEWSYNTHLLKKESIDRMMREFEQLLDVISRDPAVLLENISLSSTKLQRWKLDAWNDTAADYPRTRTLPQLLSQTAARFADKTALTFTRTDLDYPPLTYRELDEKANRMAHALLQTGLMPGAAGQTPVVGVVLDRSPDLVTTLLAILKAGAAYVPIDPDYPHDRIAFMLTDSKASLLVTSRKYRASNWLSAADPTNQTRMVVLETVLERLSDYPAVAPDVPVSATDLAYILYTSGSTGRPKGVLIEHRNLVNLLYSMIAWPGITPDDKLLAVTTVSFDIAGLELFLPLLVGATLVLADSATAKDGKALLSAVETWDISFIQATPVTYKIMLLAGWEKPLPLKILCCGEPLSKDLAQKLTARCSSLWNMYGPTETTIYSTGKQILPIDEIITIGRPIQNTQVYILDEFLHPLPEGSIGEIYLAGDGVARGYLNRPDLNAEKFVPNPFASPGERMYRTGDLGKFMDDGEIHCLGRVDQQVKIRGYRVELGEIEHALVTQPGIREAVAMAREERPGDQRLVAYLVTKPPITAETFVSQVPVWRSALRDRLPAYMVPTDFMRLEQLPVTPNGKIDRKALPRPYSAVASGSIDLTEATTSEEKIVSRLWQEALGMDRVGIDSDFFELGGHSMIAVQVMTQLEKETGKRLPLSVLMTYPTIRKLSKLIQPDVADEEPVTFKSLVPIRPEGSKEPIYIIHGIGLNLLMFSGLVRYMDPEQPIYGLQAKGLDGIDEPLDDMEAIADFYLSEVLRQNPKGPYAIAGYSFGGYVALEMARKLKAMGKEVKLLAMLDTNAQESDVNKTAKERLRLKLSRQLPKFIWISRSLWHSPMATLRYQRGYVLWQFERLLRVLKIRKAPEPEPGFELLNKIMDKHETAFENYIMRPYDGSVALFKARIRPYFVDDNKFLGWKKYALGGVRVHDVPGDHEQMLLPPNDQVFARVLQNALDDVCTQKKKATAVPVDTLSVQ